MNIYTYNFKMSSIGFKSLTGLFSLWQIAINVAQHKIIKLLSIKHRKIIFSYMNFGNIMSQRSKGWACQGEQHKIYFRENLL